jgi:hypothetical protein
MAGVQPDDHIAGTAEVVLAPATCSVSLLMKAVSTEKNMITG